MNRPGLAPSLLAVTLVSALAAGACGRRDAGPSGPAGAGAAAGHAHHGSAPGSGATQASEAVGPAGESQGDEVAYYTCSMHSSVKSATPGTCPICSMDLVPVKRQEAATGVITLDAVRRQAIGVRTAPVGTRRLEKRIRAVGKVVFDETRLADVSVKYRGWIGRLHADSTGKWVGKGEPLFTLYSPELYATQEEFLTALASQRAAEETAAPERADYLVEASRKRLLLWDLTDRQIDEIAALGKPIKYLPIVAPASGFVVEKTVVEGAAVEPGMRLFRLAGLEHIWVEAQIYEAELPLVAVGQPAEVVLPYLPGRRFSGKVAYVYPYLDDASRTGRIRIELRNRQLELKPDMYAEVELVAELGERLTVPEEAVLYAGQRRFVFLDLGEGRLKPQRVELGIRAGEEFEVLSGLAEGDVIVTSGNFLVAAESRLKLAMEHWQ
jgi:Cu(I)/Ag(I) efflux system membrane fusion protein